MWKIGLGVAVAAVAVAVLSVLSYVWLSKALADAEYLDF